MSWWGKFLCKIGVHDYSVVEYKQNYVDLVCDRCMGAFVATRGPRWFVPQTNTNIRRVK